jgi:hypothetical protein
MAIIPNFPQNLLDMHHHWHDPSAHPGAPGGRQHPFGTTGAGLEFLQFHRDFVTQFHAWYDVQPFGTAPFNVAPFLTQADAQAAVAPWTSIPAEIKNGAVTGWGGVQVAQEARLTTLSPPFASADDLGTYIEGGIHGWIHGAAAAAFNEPIVGTFHSPLSTYFYGIHGLVDYWWRQWERAQKSWIKDIIDSKARLKEFKDNKEIIKEHKEFKEFTKEHKEFKEIEKPQKEKDKEKDIFEGGGFPGGGGDPAELARRLSDLEVKVTQQAFIQPQERPMVGQVKPKK